MLMRMSDRVDNHHQSGINEITIGGNGIVMVGIMTQEILEIREVLES